MNDLYFLRYSLLGLCRASLLCGAVLFLSPQAKAQFNVYHPFPDSNAVWGMGSACLDGQCGDAAYIQNYYAGDTLIAGILYKKVQTIYVITSNNGCCSPPGIMIPGYIREDTIAKRVFLRLDGMNTDTLLYDFALQLEDTLKGFLGNCYVWTVQSIDSVVVGSSFRRRINFYDFGDCNDLSIIEGIGSTMGLIGCMTPAFEGGSGLRCFSVDGEVLYNAPAPCGPDIIPCDIQLAVEPGISGLRQLPVQIAPNPAMGTVAIDFDPILLPVEVSITDMAGKILIREVIFKEHSTIDISSLAKGLYVVQVEQDGSVISSGKIIKQ